MVNSIHVRCISLILTYGSLLPVASVSMRNMNQFSTNPSSCIEHRKLVKLHHSNHIPPFYFNRLYRPSNKRWSSNTESEQISGCQIWNTSPLGCIHHRLSSATLTERSLWPRTKAAQNKNFTQSTVGTIYLNTVHCTVCPRPQTEAESFENPEPPESWRSFHRTSLPNINKKFQLEEINCKGLLISDSNYWMFYPITQRWLM